MEDLPKSQISTLLEKNKQTKTEK